MLRTLLVRGGKGEVTHTTRWIGIVLCVIYYNPKHAERNNQQKRAVRCCQSNETNITKRELLKIKWSYLSNY